MYHDKDFLAEAKKAREELKAQRAKTLKKLQATMEQKPLTEEELEQVIKQLDNAYRNDFVVPTDNVLSKHIVGFMNS
mgnify:CR=1 FL=1